MKRPMFIAVRGREHGWTFHFDGDPKHLEEWRADGLEVNETTYAIPAWVVDLGLKRAWGFCSDVFHFRNPFR